MKRTIVFGVLLLVAFTLGFLVGERRYTKSQQREANATAYSIIVNQREANNELLKRFDEIVEKIEAQRR
jgi:hypothetical protein